MISFASSIVILSFLREAKDSSKLTIPSLIPESATGTRARIKTPFQALGARATNSLSAKLLVALLPPSTPFFKLSIDSLALIKEGGQEGLETEIDKGLRTIENALMDEIEVSNDRVAMFEALKHLIVSGNVLLYLTDKGLKVYPLEKFVSKRDEVGNVLEIITKESVNPQALPLDFVNQIKKKENYSKGFIFHASTLYCIFILSYFTFSFFKGKEEDRWKYQTMFNQNDPTIH